MLNIGGRYNKTVVALVVGAISWATIVIQSAPNKITATEWLVGATDLAIALGVYTVSNQA